MVVGLILAGIAGLALPAWIVLLQNSLDAFFQIAVANSAGADLGSLLQDQLFQLVIAFAVLGVVSMLAGFGY